jgi:hypothetical protein
VDFSSITPEMIIGPEILERDWSVRTDSEKRRTWHFHVSAHGVHGCVTSVPGDTEAEAADRALGDFMPCFQIHEGREDDGLDEIFGNDQLSYCATPGCGGCDLEVHVLRMQDQRLAEAGPVAARVVLFDLVVED